MVIEVTITLTNTYSDEAHWQTARTAIKQKLDQTSFEYTVVTEER